SAVETLYGKEAPMSASRLDKYRSCHFSYFMQYGLSAKPRKRAEFAATDYGTFVHYVLEHILQGREKGALPTKDQVSRVVKDYVDELGGLEGETARFRYLFARLEKSVYAVVKNVCEELDRSDFTPAWFELGFGGKEGTLPPVEFTADGFTVSATGFVDRVDTWEKDGKVYFRVVDYKTGKKEFDFTDVWNGMSLQMLLYLFTLKDKGKELFGGKIPVPAGVLYLPARDEAVPGYRGMSEEERQKAVDKQLCRQGLVLCEPEVLSAMEHAEEGYRFLPLKLKSTGEVTGRALVSAEQLGKLEKHTRKALEDVARELAAGKITADPFWRGPRHNACQWCDYAAACQFREGAGGDGKRWLATVSPEEFWEQLP
ncbi:MAG: PD-(D/E)XK nuclease family protein, partial [Oscillospiraceae bacterium]|nr:PD-(D/E)XK nuclease family protein [Oscillospiraceae bacterium]